MIHISLKLQQTLTVCEGYILKNSWTVKPQYVKQKEVPLPSRHSSFIRVPTEVLDQCMFICYWYMMKIESSYTLIMTCAQKRFRQPCNESVTHQPYRWHDMPLNNGTFSDKLKSVILIQCTYYVGWCALCIFCKWFWRLDDLKTEPLYFGHEIIICSYGWKVSI